MSDRKIVKRLSWKDEETALLQPNINYSLIRCRVSVTVIDKMTTTHANRQNIALIFKCLTRCSHKNSLNQVVKYKSDKNISIKMTKIASVN